MSGTSDPFASPDDPTATTPTESPMSGLPAPRPVSQTIGRIVLAILAILVVVFSLANLQRVSFKWLFGESEVVEQNGEYVSGGIPLILLLLGAFLLGLIIGWGITRRRSRVRTYRASHT